MSRFAAQFSSRSTELGAVALAATIAVVGSLGFRGTFGGWSFVTPAALAAAACLAIGVFAVYRRLLFGEAMLFSSVLFLLVGVPDPAQLERSSRTRLQWGAL